MVIEQLEIIQPEQTVEIETGMLSGKNVSTATKLLKDLENIFFNEEARKSMDPETVVYQVQVHEPVARNTEGGLLFGTTNIISGKVGDEFFMTQGHFHKIGNRGEYYWGIKGQGLLLLMDKDRNHRVELMCPGSLHYIPADTAHRVCNTGDEILSFGACWPADAGYDYGEIKEKGFSVRVLCVEGEPVVIPV